MARQWAHAASLRAQGFANNLEFPGSVRYGGRKYMVLRTVPLSDDVNTLIGSATSEPKNGLVMATTKTMVLLGNSPAGSGATGSANAQKVVGQMAEYLASQGM